MVRTPLDIEAVKGRLKLVHLCLLLSDPLLHDLHLLLPVLGLPLLSPYQRSLHPSKELQASVEVESLEA